MFHELNGQEQSAICREGDPLFTVEYEDGDKEEALTQAELMEDLYVHISASQAECLF